MHDGQVDARIIVISRSRDDGMCWRQLAKPRKRYQCQGFLELIMQPLRLSAKNSPLLALDNIKILPLEILRYPLSISKTYPEAIRQFRVALISDLKGKNLFDKVTDGAEGKASKNTVQVSGKVLSMRIASSSARFWEAPCMGVFLYRGIFEGPMPVPARLCMKKL